MSYLWTPLFVLFFLVEVFNQSICGSMHITSQMWFMWLVMAVASSKPYLNKMKGKS